MVASSCLVRYSSFSNHKYDLKHNFFFKSYGFNLDGMRILHSIVYVYTIFLGGGQTFIFLMISIMLMNTTIYCISLFDFLTHQIRKFKLNMKGTKNFSVNIHEFGNLIELHKRILELSNRLDEFCTIFLFIYYGSFIILSCLLCNDIVMVSIFIFINYIVLMTQNFTYFTIFSIWYLIMNFFTVLRISSKIHHEYNFCVSCHASNHTSFILLNQIDRTGETKYYDIY